MLFYRLNKYKTKLLYIFFAYYGVNIKNVIKNK